VQGIVVCEGIVLFRDGSWAGAEGPGSTGRCED
jgi:hypothetical protein